MKRRDTVREPVDASTLKIVLLPVDSLRPNSRNPRRMSDAELDALTHSIGAQGFIRPIIAKRKGREIIDGHHCLIAARRLGLTQVPVVLLDIPDHKAWTLALGLNRIRGDWDDELLPHLLQELDAMPDVDLSLTGFSDDEITRYVKSLEVRENRERLETFDLEAALKATPTRAKLGDLWLLSDNRLLCGDATDADHVSRLMGNEKASLMATDPPYLVDYRGGNYPASKSNRGRASKDKHWDDYHDPESAVEFYVGFLRAALPHLSPNTAIYQWHAHRRQSLVEEAWSQCGLLVHQEIIWVKARGVPSRSHYMWKHEPCLYGWVEGKPPVTKPPSDETTVWMVDQDGEQMGIHPTQKPIELFAKPISFHTRINDICLEPFSGSGTQLIACERLGRRCYALELEPRYVDIAIARWEAFAGKKATLDRD